MRTGNQFPLTCVLSWHGQGQKACFILLPEIPGVYLFPGKEEGPWDLEAWVLPRGDCMLNVSDISSEMHLDDSRVPAPPIFSATHCPELCQGCWPQTCRT